MISNFDQAGGASMGDASAKDPIEALFLYSQYETLQQASELLGMEANPCHSPAQLKAELASSSKPLKRKQIDMQRHLAVQDLLLKAEFIKPVEFAIASAMIGVDHFLHSAAPEVLNKALSHAHASAARPHLNAAWDWLTVEVLLRYHARKAYQLFNQDRMRFEVMLEIGNRCAAACWGMLEIPCHTHKQAETVRAAQARSGLYRSFGPAALELLDKRLPVVDEFLQSEAKEYSALWNKLKGGAADE